MYSSPSRFLILRLPPCDAPSPEGESEKGDPTRNTLKNHFRVAFKSPRRLRHMIIIYIYIYICIV